MIRSTSQVAAEVARQPQLPGYLFPSLALQIAHHDGRPIFFRQSAQLAVEKGQQIPPQFILPGSRFRNLRHLTFPGLPFTRRRSRFQGGSVSDRTQPIGQQLAFDNGRCLADQDEKGGLKSILGIVMVGEDTPADVPH